MERDNRLGWGGHLGLFMVSLATLMHQILLTRIFSVTMWYHFGFMVISLAMLGITAGALTVYLAPRFFTVERAKRHLALSALVFALTIVFSFLMNQSVPFVTDTSLSLIVYFSMILTFAIVAVPFFFVGITTCIALTKFSGQVSRLYAFNLTGAGLGCALYVVALRLTDGPTAVVLVGALACVGAALFAFETPSRVFRSAALLCAIGLGAFAVGNTMLVRHQESNFRLLWVLGKQESPSLYERWNPFSRVIVRGNRQALRKPFIHGMSPAYEPTEQVRQLFLVVDIIGAAPITSYDGPPQELGYLKNTVSNLVHYIRPDANVLIVGPGGGKDVLAALAFDQKHITAVEINDLVTDIMTNEFASFAGNLHKRPNVDWVTDEGRSYIARLKEPQDIIQLTFVDTFAASASGAFVLTENGLYTTEAWNLFLDRLTPDGVLTVTHYFFNELPAQMYRIVGLARDSLRQHGVEDPRRHVFLAKCRDDAAQFYGENVADDVGTILVSRTPFTDAELDRLEQLCRDMQYDIVLSPREALNAEFETLIAGGRLDTLLAKYPLNIGPPTDDSPFFFHTLQFRGIFDRAVADHGLLSVNMKAVRLLFLLLGIVGALTVVCVLLPFWHVERRVLSRSLPFLLFFTAIGLGFMFVEIAQLNKLSIFLGYPTYSLAVVLFSLLLAGGVGSYSTHRLSGLPTRRETFIRLGLLLGVLIVLGLVTPFVTGAFAAATTPVRIAVALALLLPMGFFMGMPFPMGMKFLTGDLSSMTPWLWGVNGAMSVCATILAVITSMSWGITASFFLGVLCYVVAFAAVAWGCRRLA